MVVDELFGDAVVKLQLPALADGNRTPLPYHCFAAGDMVALVEGDGPALPDSAAVEHDNAEACEGVLLHGGRGGSRAVKKHWGVGLAKSCIRSVCVENRPRSRQR